MTQDLETRQMPELLFTCASWSKRIYLVSEYLRELFPEYQFSKLLFVLVSVDILYIFRLNGFCLLKFVEKKNLLVARTDILFV